MHTMRTQCTWLLHQYAGSTVSKDPACLSFVISPISPLGLLVVALAIVFVKSESEDAKTLELAAASHVRALQARVGKMSRMYIIVFSCLFFLWGKFAQVPSQGEMLWVICAICMRFLKRRTVHLWRTRVRAWTETKNVNHFHHVRWERSWERTWETTRKVRFSTPRCLLQCHFHHWRSPCGPRITHRLYIVFFVFFFCCLMLFAWWLRNDWGCGHDCAAAAVGMGSAPREVILPFSNVWASILIRINSSSNANLINLYVLSTSFNIFQIIIRYD